MKRKIIAVLVALMVFFTGVMIIAYFRAKSILSLTILAACTVSTYQIIANKEYMDDGSDKDDNLEK